MTTKTPLLRAYRDRFPALGERTYVDPAATVIGDVVLGDDVSVWPQTVIRGDVNFIRIGARTNLQDGTVVHVSHDGPHAKLGGFATVIGEDVTIGHKAIIHACRIGAAALVGMGAIMLNGARIGNHCLVGAGALITEGKEFPDNSMIVGAPARRVRDVREDEQRLIAFGADVYVKRHRQYAKGLRRLG